MKGNYWTKAERNRLNPQNELCLNSIHDRALDQGFMTITTDFKILVSKYFDDYTNETAVKDLFLKYNSCG